MKKLKVLSLFSGAGGLDLGFEAAGFSVVMASDIMAESCDTLRQNNPRRPVFGPPNYSGDIFDLGPDVIHEITGYKSGEIDVMVGGPPCQPFSMAAAQRFLKSDDNFKRKGFDCEEKGKLIFAYADLIKTLRPKAFLIENVPGILSIDGGGGINYVLSELREAGYHIESPMVLDAKDYGVPQSRKRAFVIGSLIGSGIKNIPPTHGEPGNLFLQPYTTVSQALNEFGFDLPNSNIRNHAKGSVKRYKSLSFGQREKLGRVDRLNPDRPSKTVIAGGTSGGGRSHLHPFQARTLSVRECARLQTFPDDYIFLGKNGRQFTQVGNAVPPLLAEVIARKIMSVIFKRKVPRELVHAVPLFQTDGEEGSFLQTHAATGDLLAWSLRTRPDLLYNDVDRARESETAV